MNEQSLQFGWHDKLAMGVISILLFVVGFFASLLALAVGVAMALVFGVKMWLINRRHSNDIIEAEYRVLRE